MITGKFLSYFGAAAVPPGIGPITRQGGNVVIPWIGNVLESSTDLKTWAPEAAAASPLVVTPSDNKFYRSRN